VQVSFRNSYNTEPTFDGAVLELSINGGAFSDILAAGGTFATGGYNGAIVPTDSVLTGRAAWTGSSSGFITTVVNLPDASFSQNIQLRWHLASDTGTNPTGGGIRIDTLSINTISYVCCEGACMLSCPLDITVPNDHDQAGAVVSYPATGYSGNCGTLSTSPASGSFFPLGLTPVTTTARRLDDSFDSCIFNITVNDTQFPVVSIPTVDKPTLWPPDHQMIAETVSYTASDNDSVACTLSVASNELINGLGDGDTAPDWIIGDDHHLQLRSERGGKGRGRTYTITVTCADPAGNTVIKTVPVSVPFSQKTPRSAVNSIR